MKIAVAQINTIVGDISSNTKKIIENINLARDKNVELVVFPELTITGYPPEDLLLRKKFVLDNLVAVKEIIKSTKNIAVIIGFVNKIKKNIFNAASFIFNKKILSIHHKNLLPNYSVFDEKRYFTEGNTCEVINFMDVKIGINICEDIWHNDGPAQKQIKKGAELIINISASPYYFQKTKDREKILKNLSLKNKIAVIYCNLIGGQDELVFDGESIAFDKTAKEKMRGNKFKEELILLNYEKGNIKSSVAKSPTTNEEIYKALVLGTKDYCLKNKFKKVCLGLSGGIDSALTACIAVDALGKENVVGVFMPSKFTSKESFEDASQLAKNLNIKFLTVPITEAFASYKKMLRGVFKNLAEDITEENLQARIRGNILMALSNKFNYLVLTTGNKSEMSVGYATLYGDMAGGFAVIKDVPKTLVYKVSAYRNTLTSVIPERIFTKAPTAELRENQKDSDSLPPYEILDPIIHSYVEEDKSYEEIIKLGFAKEVVKKVIKLIDKSEYKRRQAPPGVKITPKSFGKDRRMPITNGSNNF